MAAFYMACYKPLFRSSVFSMTLTEFQIVVVALAWLIYRLFLDPLSHVPGPLIAKFLPVRITWSTLDTGV